MVVAHGDAGYTLVQQLLVRGRGRVGGRGRGRGRDRDRVRVRGRGRGRGRDGRALARCIARRMATVETVMFW